MSKAKRCWVGNGWIKRKRSVWRRRKDGKDGVIEGLEQEEKDGGIGRKTEERSGEGGDARGTERKGGMGGDMMV